MIRLRPMLLTLLAFCLGTAAPAHAAVTVSFYSHDFGERFPPSWS